MAGKFIKLTDIEDNDPIILNTDLIGCVFQYDHEKHGKIFCVALNHPILVLDGRMEFYVKEDLYHLGHLLHC